MKKTSNLYKVIFKLLYQPENDFQADLQPENNFKLIFKPENNFIVAPL
jgi:hypothetical protein